MRMQSIFGCPSADIRAALLPISGRTSLEGHTIALQEKGSAILVCLDKMDRILDVNAMNGDAVVQAVRTSTLLLAMLNLYTRA